MYVAMRASMNHSSIALVLVVAAAAACSSAPSNVTPPPPVMDASSPVPPTSNPVTNELALRTTMNQLWEDHVFWTRIYIIDAVSGLDGSETAVSAKRLLQNQIEIGNAIRPFYGVDAGNKLTALLNQHILGAVDVLDDAIKGDTAAFNTANDAWYQNGYEIAQFLSAANPNWPLAVMTAHMNRHLDLTLQEATARLSGDYAVEVQAYDLVVDHILTLSDVLTNGIVAQFHDKVSASPISPQNEKLHTDMRKLWEDHVQWTRIYLVDQTSNDPDTGLAAGRLLQNQTDIGNAVKPFYGEAGGTQLTMLLKDHITGAVGVLNAFESGDATAIQNAKDAWYANADAIAQFLAAANPNWRLADLQFHMKLHLDQTLAEAGARLVGQWSADVTAYDAVVAHIRQMADILSDGIAKQFPQQVP
jgi:hypothetical protein